jgi:pimeloyl-ACP methyl ester carboxylesterase
MRSRTAKEGRTTSADRSGHPQWLAGQDPPGRQVGKLRVPTLIADGTLDRLDPTANARLLVRSVPGARLILYPDAGHAFLFQDASSFIPAVESFLD